MITTTARKVTIIERQPMEAISSNGLTVLLGRSYL
jgi:hypothetical protein